MNIDDFVKIIRGLADKHPDRTADCQNFEEDTEGGLIPVCIVGHAFVIADLEDKANYIEQSIGEGMFSELVEHGLGIEVSDVRSVDWVQRVQDRQDAGDPWGAAVVAADRLVKL